MLTGAATPASCRKASSDPNPSEVHIDRRNRGLSIVTVRDHANLLAVNLSNPVLDH